MARPLRFPAQRSSPTVADDPASGAAPGGLRPTARGERLGYLDFLRGVALLGIVPENVPYFAYPVTLADLEPVRASGPWYDLTAMYLVRVLGDYSFLTLFALLFGVGMGLVQRRCAAAGRPFRPLISRRMLVLGAFGVLHALLLWYGDILLFFAVGGLIAMWMAEWSARALCRAGAALICVPLVVMLAGAALLPLVRIADGQATGRTARPGGDEASRTADAPSDAAVPERAAAAPERPLAERGRTAAASVIRRYLHPDNETRHYREGPLRDMFIGRLITWGYALVYMMIYMQWRIVGLFLIGMAIVRHGAFLRPEADPAPFRRALRIGLSVGLPLHAAYLAYPLVGPLNDAGELFMESLKYAGSLGMAAAYAALAALVWARAQGRPWTRPLRAIGCSTLTAYILSSVTMSLIFYSYGLAWFNRLGRAQVLALVPVVWLVCLAVCGAWMSRFRFGPLEWTWRRLTYGGRAF